MLLAAATQTERIRLTSAASVLSSADPVRLFEEFATLDLLSGGRAEIAAGRGAYVESFPLSNRSLCSDRSSAATTSTSTTGSASYWR